MGAEQDYKELTEELNAISEMLKISAEHGLQTEVVYQLVQELNRCHSTPECYSIPVCCELALDEWVK